MKRLLFTFIISAVGAFAQWSDFSAQTSASNLSTAMNAKLSWQVSATPPSTCAAGKEVYLNTATPPQAFLCTPGNIWAELINAGVSYSNPAWLTALAYNKITGVPSFAPLASPTFTGTVTAPNITFTGGMGTVECLHRSSAGVVTGTGSDCGGGGGGANSSGYYGGGQSANAPANGVNLGALSSGLMKIAISGGVATPSTAISGTDYQAAITAGTSLQYVRGDFSLATFPTTWAWAALTGVPSTFPPINSGDWAGTWQTHAPSYFQTAISGAPGTWPSTFPPVTSGDWAGTWETHAPGYFQTAISGAPGTWPSTWAWASLTGVPTMPAGTIVGNTDTQVLTNKTVDGVKPT